MSIVGSELAIDQVGLKLAVIFLSLKGFEEWPYLIVIFPTYPTPILNLYKDSRVKVTL